MYSVILFFDKALRLISEGKKNELEDKKNYNEKKKRIKKEMKKIKENYAEDGLGIELAIEPVIRRSSRLKAKEILRKMEEGDNMPFLKNTINNLLRNAVEAKHQKLEFERILQENNYSK